MREIPLSRGLVALVDDEDYERVVALGKWCADRGRHTEYAVLPRTSRRKKMYLHRFLTGAPRGLDVDHINGDGLDNRRTNIRVVTRAQNQRNRTRKQDGCSSRFKGVTFHKQTGKWQAQIAKGTAHLSLGLHATERAAQEAYANGALLLFGEHAAPYVEAAE